MSNLHIDDIIVYSVTFSEHLVRLRNVLQRIKNAGLRLKVSKCCFAQAKVQYVGHVVSAQGVEPDPAKIQSVATYPVPRNVKELRQFLGLSNYYRRFVQDYSRIARGLCSSLSRRAFVSTIGMNVARKHFRS